MQRKTERIAVMLEPIIYTALSKAISNDGLDEGPVTISTYIRKVLIDDLLERGLLTPETLQQLAS